MFKRLAFFAPLLILLALPSFGDNPGAVTRLPSIAALRQGNFVNVGGISVDSYYAGTGSGGGVFAPNLSCTGPGGSTLTDNGGTVIKDSAGNCWIRQGAGSSVGATSFGVRCDAITTINDGAITSGDNHFTSTAITFSAADVGKTLQMTPAGTANPWVTTISAVSGHTATLANNAFTTFPGALKAKTVVFNSNQTGGLDAPGSGYKQGDTLTGSDGVFSSAATATVIRTGLVAITMTSGGTNYQAGDQIGLTSTTGNTVLPAVVSVLTVDGSGVILTYSIIDGGQFKVNGANPTAFTQSGGHGSGFTFSLLVANGSFGIGYVTLGTKGSYTTLPPIPGNTTDSGTGTGAQVEWGFTPPTWTYGTDDTANIASLESYLETVGSRGQYSSAVFPSNAVCLASGITIARPVSWYGGGSRSTIIQMIVGSAGVSVNGSASGFLVIATGFPAIDPYQNTGISQNQPSLHDIQISGTDASTTVDVGNSSGVTTGTNCIVLTNPAAHNSVNVGVLFDNVQSKSCPGSGLVISPLWVGELIAYNFVVGGMGSNCIDVSNYHNPSRFYRLIASGCGNYGLRLDTSSSLEFHGASVFGNLIDIYVSGVYTKSNGGYLLFDGLQFGSSTNENMYLDQSNETVYCTGICRFKDANQGGSSSSAEANSSLAIGPDASSDIGPISTGLTQPVIVIDDGIFQAGDNSNFNDVFFIANQVSSTTCQCVVQIGGSTRNVDTGIIASNQTGQLSGPQFTVSPTMTTQFAAARGMSVTSGHTLISQTAPTIGSSFGTGPSIVSNNGPASFQINVGTGGTATTGVIGLPAAAHGWSCFAVDITTPAGNLTRQSGETTTSATFKNYSAAGVLQAWPASDVLNVSCLAR